MSKEVTENDLLTTRTSYHHGFWRSYYLPELTTIVYVFDRDLRSRGPSFSKFVKNVVEVTRQVFRFAYVIVCKYFCTKAFKILYYLNNLGLYVWFCLWQTEQGVRLCFFKHISDAVSGWDGCPHLCIFRFEMRGQLFKLRPCMYCFCQWNVE